MCTCSVHEAWAALILDSSRVGTGNSPGRQRTGLLLVFPGHIWGQGIPLLALHCCSGKPRAACLRRKRIYLPHNFGGSRKGALDPLDCGPSGQVDIAVGGVRVGLTNGKSGKAGCGQALQFFLSVPLCLWEVDGSILGSSAPLTIAGTGA